LGLMTCLICGDICRCSSEADPVLASAGLKHDNACPELAAQQTLEIPCADLRGTDAGLETAHEDCGEASSPEGPTAWRQEVAARLNRYQARHKPRPPRYPSLRLRFEEEARPAEGSAEPAVLEHTSEPFSHQAVALDRFSSEICDAIEPLASAGPEQASNNIDPGNWSAALTPLAPHLKAQATAKILEFPRSWTPPPAPLNELAEPVIDRPRILEAPEFVPPPPALGGITIEPAARPAAEKRPGIDIPLQSASLRRRIFSAAVDDAIIGMACALFGFIFWKMTATRPPRIQISGLVAGLSGVFWATYEYLLLVYSGTTPGLRLAKLELARFDGTPVPRRLRRWRVLASFLSAGSLGLGYLWAFLDEDVLCWHDRITHTYLAPKRERTAA
jgi:uncharacterized RDD family membrane protein YckC